MLIIDHRQTLKYLYHPSSKTPVIIDVPEMNFLMVDGHGKPDGEQFPRAASVLFPLAYCLKWMVRLGSDLDFHVMPMEVLWKVNRQKKEFAWTMLLMQPEFVTPELVIAARQKVQSKVDEGLLAQVRFEQLSEGLCVQLMHRGPYEGMDASADRMEAFASEQGCRIPLRNSHDIYLNDVRKTKPANLKTVMRLQVRQPNEMNRK